MAVLALLQADVRTAARLTAALTGEHEVVMRTSWDALVATLRDGPLEGCVVDADHPDADTATWRIASILEEHGDLAVIACVEEPHGPGYYRLGAMGVAGMLTSAAVAAGRTRGVVDRSLAMARADRVARALESRFADPGPAAIRWSIAHAGPDTSVKRLADSLGHTPRSLREALEDAGLPAPTRVLLWGRLLLAGARLGQDHRTVEEVAFSLGYSTATSLGRAMKQQTGLTPREVSEGGGIELVREALFPPGAGTDRRRARMGKIASVALCALLAACAGIAGGRGAVDRDAVEAAMETPPVDQVHFGVLAVDARTGRSLYERNAHRWFVPASNQKILLTAAAWSLLGPDFRFRTDVWATGPTRAGALAGDLIVVPSGDPSLSSRYWPSGREALRALADSVRASGIHAIEGALLVDASAWDSTTVGPTREVEDLRFAYGATGGIFGIEEGELGIVVRGRPPVGGLAEVDSRPRGGRAALESLVRTGPPGTSTRVVSHYLPEARRIVLEGRVAYGSVDTVSIAQRDPVRHASAAFADALAQAGVRLGRGWAIRWNAGDVLDHPCVAGAVDECAGARLVATLESPPLAELVAGVLGPSQNWMAEQLILTLGAERGGGGTWSEGVSIMEAFLVDVAGVPADDVSARDGSGLSAYNLVTPRAIVRVLRHMMERPDGGAYRSAMAEPGEEGSTLENRLVSLRGRVFAKTGSISNVNSLSGYLIRDGGDQVIFSILSNGGGLPASRARSAIDQIVVGLAR